MHLSARLTLAKQAVGILALLALPLASCSQALTTPTLPSMTRLAEASATLPPASATPVAVSTISVTPQPAITPTLPVAPAQIPNPAAYQWSQVVNGINAPTDIQNAGDGSGRLFILEQPGRIRILPTNGGLQAIPFLDISGRIGSGGSEQGLLGLAFHPEFARNGYFYVNYTDLNGNTHISRFTGSGDSADPESEKNLLTVKQPFPNHNGGALAFGPDGFLYIGLGDGGSAGDPYGNAQSSNSLLGKILRIDVNNGDPYAVPGDNSYASDGAGYKEIWASGVRNPWRFSFDKLTGDLWIGDVGQNLWEEIDFVRALTPGGLNFGWNKMEATHPYKGVAGPEFTAPIAEYPHAAECSVTGGYVYRGAAMPDWQGVYFYGDYCSGAMWGLTSPPQGAQPTLLFQTGFRISTFGTDEAGELYAADYNGAIYRLEKSH